LVVSAQIAGQPCLIGLLPQLEESICTMKHTILTALLALAAVSAPALADGFYVGAELGRSQLDGIHGVDGVSDSNVRATSAGVYAGYAFNPMLSVEFGYHGLGKGTGETTVLGKSVSFDTKVKAATLSGIASLPFTDTDRLSGYGRLGYTRISNSEHYGVVEFEETQNKMMAGLGLRYAASKNVGVRAEYTKYASDFNVLSLGVDYTF
jgi:opacity protein-like surface antigen